MRRIVPDSEICLQNIRFTCKQLGKQGLLVIQHTEYVYKIQGFIVKTAGSILDLFAWMHFICFNLRDFDRFVEKWIFQVKFIFQQCKQLRLSPALNILHILYTGMSALHAGYRFFKISFLKIQETLSRTTAPILDLFVLILMHFHAGSNYGNKNLNLKFFFTKFNNFGLLSA